MLVKISREEAIDLNYPRGCLKRVNYWSDWYYVDHRRVARQRRRAFKVSSARCRLRHGQCDCTVGEMIKCDRRYHARRS